MILHSVKPVEHDWLDIIHPQDRVLVACDSMMQQLAALQDCVKQLQTMLKQQQQYKFVVLFPDGSRMHCLCDSKSFDEAMAEAERIAVDLHEFAIVEKIELLTP